MCVFNVDKLVDYLQNDRKWGGRVTKSDDAGLYLCEWTYFTSLNEAKLGNIANSDRPTYVLFVHVPWPTAEFSEEELTQVLEDTLIWLTKDWLEQDKVLK